MSTRNRLSNCENRFQGTALKVLCVCSAGLLRSPTAAHILSSDPFNFNTRAVGASKEYALCQLDSVMVKWADVIVCMEPEHAEPVYEIMRELDDIDFTYSDRDRKVHILNCPDNFAYMNVQLKAFMLDKFTELFLKSED